MHRKKMLRIHKGKDFDNKVTIISPVVKIPTPDDILAVLASADEEKSIAVTINENTVKLNNNEINVSEVVNINERDTSVFLSNFFPASDLKPRDTRHLCELISRTLRTISQSDTQMFTNYIVKILDCFPDEIQSKIVVALAFLLKTVTPSSEKALDVIFRDRSKYFHLADATVCFFGARSERLRDRWKSWVSTRREEHYMPFFEQVDEEELDGSLFFEKAVNACFRGSGFDERAGEELASYFNNWLAKRLYDGQVGLERAWRREGNSAGFTREKVPCAVCGGYFYKLSRS